jgi:signal transduction histidine kinase
MVDLLAPSLAHDLRQPLNVMRLFARVMRSRHPDDHQVHEAFTRALDDLDHTLDRLVDLLRTRPATPAATDLARLWQDLDPSITSDVPAPCGVLPMDAHSARILLSELIRNAKEHAAGPYRVVVGEDDQNRWLDVLDTGPGVSMDTLTNPTLTGTGRPRTVAVGLARVHTVLSSLDARLLVPDGAGGIRVLLTR